MRIYLSREQVIRLKGNKTYVQIAKESGVPRSTLNELLNHKFSPRANTLYKLAECLDVYMDELIIIKK